MMGNSHKTCLDLFAGAGGLTEGLRQAGFKSLFANEISPIYSETLKKNHPDSEIETGDICSLDPEKIRKQLGLAKGELSLLAGGPPCQGFSVNAPVRSVTDKRNHLFLDYIRFVEAFNPSVVLIENVPGIVSFERGETVGAIISSLKKLGYQSAVRILFAAHYGVPQMRWRTIFIANRIGIDPADMFPLPSHFAKGRANFTTKYLGHSLVIDPHSLRHLQPSVTVAQALSDLPAIENGGGSSIMAYSLKPESEYQKEMRRGAKILYNHQAAGLGQANLVRLPHIPPGGSWRDIPFDLLPSGMQRARRSDHTKRYGRLDPHGLGSTILTKCDPHWGTYIHPNQDRIISAREAARLQSFPDQFRFYGSLTEQYEQIGNAVPPLFACALGKAIIAAVEHSDDTKRPKFWHSPQMQLPLAHRESAENSA